MPIHMELNALAIVTRTKDMEEDSPLQARYNQLMQLEEQRAQALTTMNKRQEIVKRILIRVLLSKTSKNINWCYSEQSKGEAIIFILSLKLSGSAISD
jgi:flagellar basal body-associated protein FliL